MNLYTEMEEQSGRVSRKWRELWSWSMFMLPAQVIDWLLVDSLWHMHLRLSNDVLSEYWLVHVDYHYQLLVAVAQVPQYSPLGRIVRPDFVFLKIEFGEFMRVVVVSEFVT